VPGRFSALFLASGHPPPRLQAPGFAALRPGMTPGQAREGGSKRGMVRGGPPLVSHCGSGHYLLGVNTFLMSPNAPWRQATRCVTPVAPPSSALCSMYHL